MQRTLQPWIGRIIQRGLLTRSESAKKKIYIYRQTNWEKITIKWNTNNLVWIGKDRYVLDPWWRHWSAREAFNIFSHVASRLTHTFDNTISELPYSETHSSLWSIPCVFNASHYPSSPTPLYPFDKSHRSTMKTQR